MKFVREDSLNSGVPGIKTGYIFESECVAHIDVPSHIVVFFTLEPTLPKYMCFFCHSNQALKTKIVAHTHTKKLFTHKDSIRQEN